MDGELLLISKVLAEGEEGFTSASNLGVNSYWFFGYREVWKFVAAYHKKYKKIPSKQLLGSRFPKITFPKAPQDDMLLLVASVKEMALSNSIIRTIEGASEKVADNPKQAFEYINTRMKKINSYFHNQIDDSNITENYKEYFEEVKKRARIYRERGMIGVPTGFKGIDDITGGCVPGNLWIIAARPSMGKSWLALRMAVTAALSNYKVLFISLEMTKMEVAFRVHTFASSAVGRNIIRNMDLLMGKIPDLKEYADLLKKLKNRLADTEFRVSTARDGKFSPSLVAAKIDQYKPDIVFIDYLSLMQTDSGKIKDWSGIQELTRDLKLLASEYNVPVVVAAQINRKGGETDKPKLEHLSFGDSIGMDADQVLILRRLSRRVLEIYSEKTRHGEMKVHFFCEYKVNDGVLREVSEAQADKIITSDKLAEK